MAGLGLLGGGVAIGATTTGGTVVTGIDSQTCIWGTPVVRSTPLPQPNTKLYSPPGFSFTVTVPTNNLAVFVVQEPYELLLQASCQVTQPATTMATVSSPSTVRCLP